MLFAIRSIPRLYPLTQFSHSALRIDRLRIPPVHTNHFHSLAFQKFKNLVLTVLTGYPRRLNFEQANQLSEHHQKLFVAHITSGNPKEASESWEVMWSIHMGVRDKEFKVQRHYLQLFKKDTSELTPNQIDEIIRLYLYALKECSLVASIGIERKLKEYEALARM